MRRSNQPCAIMEVDDLLSALKTFQQPLSLPELVEITSRIQLSRGEWQERVSFNSQQFCFQTFYESPYFEVNLIGWRSGQTSSIHDHCDSACCVLVLEGVLTNRDFHVGFGNTLKENARIDFASGEILARSGREIHCCGNEQSNEARLVTLHLYSPPLRPLCERKYSG